MVEMITPPQFDSVGAPGGDRVYNLHTSVPVIVRSMVGTGVRYGLSGSPADLGAGNLGVVVAPGAVSVDGFVGEFDDAETVELDPADSSSRVDLVVAQLDRSGRTMTVEPVTGTPGQGAPSVPTDAVLLHTVPVAGDALGVAQVDDARVWGPVWASGDASDARHAVSRGYGDSRYARQGENLADLTSPSQARSALELGSMATRTQGTGESQHRTNAQADSRHGIQGTAGSQQRTNSQNDGRFLQSGGGTMSGDLLFNNSGRFIRVGPAGEIPLAAGSVRVRAAVGDPGVAIYGSGTGGRQMIGFVNPNGTVGSIQSSGNSTSYNTSSDYRLKSQVVDAEVAAAAARLALVRVREWLWPDGRPGRGVVAHEFAEPYPDAVTGVKDEVDADGDPVIQGVDLSHPSVGGDVLLLLNDARRQIAKLAARVAELEGAS